MEYLIPMTDFVLEQEKRVRESSYSLEDYYRGFTKISNYANFLKKPKKLGYFIACDENDVPLEEPKGTNTNSSFFEMQVDYHCENKYQEAKQRVLFEGFEYNKENDWVTYNKTTRFFVSELQNGTIEDLFNLITSEIKLTNTNKKINGSI